VKRIIIIGCGGSGKSTLARQLGTITGLPVVHLDQIWWAPGNWQHISREEFQLRLEAELEKPAWILDGNFNQTLECRLSHCDTVIYLDRNRFVCLRNWIKRVISNRGSAREDMAPGCEEHFNLEMAQWIWCFNAKNRSRYHRMLSEQKGKEIYVLKNQKQIEAFIRSRIADRV